MFTTKSAHQPLEDGHRIAVCGGYCFGSHARVGNDTGPSDGRADIGYFQERADAEDSESVERASGL